MMPPKFLERGLALADGLLIYGVPLEKLTRQELLAVAAQGWQAYRQQLGERVKRSEE